jgi:putative sterol carrier protein
MEAMENLFGSEAWIQRYQEEVNKSDRYKTVAATWEGDFYFVVLADGMLDQDVVYYLDLWHGECRYACLVKDEAGYSPAFRLESDASNWQAIVTRKLDPIQGMMTRRIKLQGDMARIMRYVPAAQELVNCATRVPTLFPDARA